MLKADEAMPGLLASSTPSRSAAHACFRLGLFALFVGVLLVRVVYVSLFAEDLPYWDQWDSEGDGLLRPWVDGNWHLWNLLDAHNEHRVVFTRLLTLALFWLNSGQWDNLVEAYVNVGIYAAMCVLLGVLLCRHESDWRMRIATLIFVFAGAVLPFGWENMLVGFQSAFLFMMAAAIGMIAIAAYRPASSSTLWLLCLLGAASLFTFASGLLSSAVVAAVVLLRHWQQRLRPVFLFAALGCMALITAAGLALIPDIPSGTPFKAASVQDLLSAAAIIYTWPLQPFASYDWPIGLGWFAIVLWAPSLIWLFRLLRHRAAAGSELFAGGLLLWVALQCIAIAYTRGHHMTVLASRYADIAAMGLLLNAWFAAKLAFQPYEAPATSLPAYAIALAFFSIAIWGLAIRTPADLKQVRVRHQLVSVQAENARHYIRTGNFRHLQQPLLGIPYPDSNRLRILLDDPAIRAILPGLFGAPIEPGRLSAYAHHVQDVLRKRLPQSDQATRSATRILADINAAKPTPYFCVVEEINSEPMSELTHLPDGSVINLAGWVISSAKTAPVEFTLLFRGENAYGFHLPTGVSRPDVAKAVDSIPAGTAGFSANVTLAGLTSGTYEVLTLVGGSSGSELCDSHRRLVISN